MHVHTHVSLIVYQYIRICINSYIKIYINIEVIHINVCVPQRKSPSTILRLSLNQ
jgi:hypothetical protein